MPCTFFPLVLQFSRQLNKWKRTCQNSWTMHIFLNLKTTIFWDMTPYNVIDFCDPRHIPECGPLIVTTAITSNPISLRLLANQCRLSLTTKGTLRNHHSVYLFVRLWVTPQQRKLNIILLNSVWCYIEVYGAKLTKSHLGCSPHGAKLLAYVDAICVYSHVIALLADIWTKWPVFMKPRSSSPTSSVRSEHNPNMAS